MACLKSRPAWEMKKRYPDEKTKLRFTQPKPYREPDLWTFCGKCAGCQERKKKDWGIRCYHESQMHEKCCFLTVTYDEQYVPERISRKHLSNFMKRLKRLYGKQIRYFGVGEYGEKTGRPHYHVIIFGEDFRDKEFTFLISEKAWGNMKLQELWGMGAIHISDLNPARAFYTAGYTAKKLDDPDTFSIKSSNPPIGKSWVERYADNLLRLHSVRINGQEYPIPRVYLEWIRDMEGYEELKEALSEAMTPLTDQQGRAKKANMEAKFALRSSKV